MALPPWFDFVFQPLYLSFRHSTFKPRLFLLVPIIPAIMKLTQWMPSWQANMMFSPLISLSSVWPVCAYVNELDYPHLLLDLLIVNTASEKNVEQQAPTCKCTLAEKWWGGVTVETLTYVYLLWCCWHLQYVSSTWTDYKCWKSWTHVLWMMRILNLSLLF